MDREEFRSLLRSCGVKFEGGQDTIDALVEEADSNGDGIIQYEEFLPAMVKLLSKDVVPFTADQARIARWNAEQGYLNEIHPRTVAITNSHGHVQPPGGVWEAPRSSYFTDDEAQTRHITIHVVRHGEVHNPGKIMYGQLTGYRLSLAGQGQTSRAAAFLKEKQIGAVYSSPMQRAHETAHRLSSELPSLVTAAGIQKVRIDASLDEIITPHEGQDLRSLDSIEWDIYNPTHAQFDMTRHETFEEVGARTVAGVQKIARLGVLANLNEIVVVSHGDPIQALRLWASGLEVLTEHREGSKLFAPLISKAAFLPHGIGFVGAAAQCPLQDKYPTHGSVTSITMDIKGEVHGVTWRDDFGRNEDAEEDELEWDLEHADDDGLSGTRRGPSQCYWLDQEQKQEAVRRLHPQGIRHH